MTTNPFISTTSGLAPNAGQLGTPGAITATSVTSVTIGLGSFSFQVQPQAAFAPGMLVSIVDSANQSNYMLGVVTSYSSTTLIITVNSIAGSGTIATWQINLAGGTGPAGATGATGATGAAGTSAGPVISSSQGLKIFNNAGTPNTKVDVAALNVQMVNSSGVSHLASPFSATVDLTVGTATSTVNGMDGEARGTSNWMYLYAISNGTTNGLLMTLTSPFVNPPTMPSGYTFSAYLGSMRTDGSGNLYRTRQLGYDVQYVVTASTNTAALPTEAAGSNGSITVPTWVAVQVAGFCSPIASKIRLLACAQTSADTVMIAPNNAYGPYNSATNQPPFVIPFGSPQVIELIPESGNFYYASNDANALIQAVGWSEYSLIT